MGKVQENVSKNLCYEAANIFIAFVRPFTTIYPRISLSQPVGKYYMIITVEYDEKYDTT